MLGQYDSHTGDSHLRVHVHHNHPVGMHQWRVLLLVVLMWASAVRVVDLQVVPPGLSGDEGINATDALSISTMNLPIFFPRNYGREPLFIYILACTLRLFGNTAFTLRWSAGLFGFMSLPLSYVLAKRLWGRRAALMLVSLLAVSLWPIWISRVGLRAVTLVPVLTLAIYGLARGLGESQLPWFIVAGISMGLVPYTYVAGRVAPVIPVAWLSLAAFSEPRIRSAIWVNRYRLLSATLLTLAIITPLTVYILRNPEVANRRLLEVGGPLEALERGELQPVAVNLLRVAGMFTFQGDPTLRYNIPGRPIFGCIIGLFFYIGFVICLIQWRDPRVQLLLIWLGLMLVPTVLSEAAPSFLRATGALVPIYILPAFGMSYTWHFLDTRGPSGYRKVALLSVILLVIGQGGNAVRGYFGTWATYPGINSIYGDRIRYMAEQLDALLPVSPESQVLIVCYYAPDVCEEMMRLQTHYRGQIRAFSGYGGIVLPAPVLDRPTTLIYLYGHALPLTPSAEWVLSSAELVANRHSIGGSPEAAVYRLTGDAYRETVSRLPVKSLGHYEDELEFLAAYLPTIGERGAQMRIDVLWRIPASVPNRQNTLYWDLTLEDGQGYEWQHISDQFIFPPKEWRAGDLVMQEMVIEVPLDVSVQPLTPTLRLRRDLVGLTYYDDQGIGHRQLVLPSLVVTGHPTVSPPPDLLGCCGGNLRLVQFTVPSTASPGSNLGAIASWYVVEVPVDADMVQIQLRRGQCDGTTVYTDTIMLGTTDYPSSDWQLGEQVRTPIMLTLPRDLAEGEYRLTVEASEPSCVTSQYWAQLACQPVRVIGRTHSYTVTEAYSEIDRSLSDGIRLLGYNLVPSPEVSVALGDILELTLYWQADQVPVGAYTVFTHLYDPDGQLVTQHDGLPCNAGCPTTSWLPGEIIPDVHELEIPESCLPGSYTLVAGLYDSKTLERLQIAGSATSEITLTPIRILITQ